jgi:hypothetical protein
MHVLREYMGPAVIAAWIGAALITWDLPQHVFGKAALDAICVGTLTHEYFITLAVAVPLGAVFPRDWQPLVCALSLALVPVVLADAAHIIAAGSVPNIYPAVLITNIIFSMPHVAAAYAGALARRKARAHIAVNKLAHR